MGSRKCRTTKCKNTFQTETAKIFCDNCLEQHRAAYIKKVRIRYKKDKAFREKKLAYMRAYSKDHAAMLREYKRDWMRNYRAGLPKGKRGRPRKEVHHTQLDGKCKNCAYRLMGETVCPRCGK